MAKCPKCGAAQDSWKVLNLAKTELMSCWRCSSILALDSQRATILLAGLVAMLVLPETRLLPFDIGLFWFFLVLAFYLPFYVRYAKLKEVESHELKVSAEQERTFQAYAAGRRHLDYLGHALLWGGLAVFLADAFSPLFGSNEAVSALALGAMIVGLPLLSLTRCPFCRKITVRILFAGQNKCINCHRDIESDG